MKLILRNFKGQFIDMMLTATVRRDDNLRFIRLKEYFSDFPKIPLQLTIWEDELKELYETLSKESDKIEVIREGIQTIRDVMDETGFVDPDIAETLNTIDSLLTDLEAEH